MEKINVQTPACIVCGKEGWVTVPWDQCRTWMAGAFAQDAFPDLSAPLREQILTGTHPVCWDEMFGDEDEDECPSGCTCAFCTA